MKGQGRNSCCEKMTFYGVKPTSLILAVASCVFFTASFITVDLFTREETEQWMYFQGMFLTSYACSVVVMLSALVAFCNRKSLKVTNTGSLFIVSLMIGTLVLTKTHGLKIQQESLILAATGVAFEVLLYVVTLIDYCYHNDADLRVSPVADIKRANSCLVHKNDAATSV